MLNDIISFLSSNRLMEMIYPDEEKVTYSYNLGGLLEKVRGEKSYGYDYITKLGYDKFEQRSYLKYCNGAETFYTYDNRRRLSNLAVNSGNTAIMDNDYTFDAVSNVLSVANNASLPASGNAGGKMSHAYTYDGLYRLASATGTYTGADSKSASYTLAMGYDNMHRITSKSQHLTQDNVQFNGKLNVGYDLSYTYGTEAGKKFQLASVKDVNYRTEETPGENNVENNHVYTYDKNGNLVYVNTGRLMNDGHNETGTGERKLIWDEENRLLAVDDNGFVSNYWYDADGERTVKTSGESDQVYVNGVFSGGSTNTAKFSLYVSPYLVANQGGRYTKHIYAGSQRIVSKIGDFASYGSDPRRIEYAGANTDGLSVDYKAKYAAQQQVIKDNYKFFDVPYNGTDNDNYADGEGFCCNDGSMEAAVAQTRKAQSRAVARSFKDPDNYENLQFFYHPDHLGSSSFITNLEGEVVQHIEYVPFGEVFIEERNNVWNTPYLFNAKEFDEETGMYYYGARYYEPRISIWISVDPIYNYDPRNSENYLDGEHNGGIYNYANLNPYIYCYHRPTLYVDPNGKQGISGAIFGAFVGGFTEYASIVGSKVLFENKTFKEANMSLRWRDVLDISVSAGFGAASGLIDNGISRMTQWIAKPRNRKIVTKILETGMDMMEEALKQYIGDGEISISSMLVGTLTEVGMGNLIGEKYVKKALGEANNAVNVAERRLADLSKRRHPNAKLIHKAQEEVNNAKQFLNLIKGIDVGSETAKKTISKGVSDKVD